MTSERWERMLSIVLTFAAMVIAFVAIRREFFAPVSRLQARALPSPVANWERLFSDGRVVGNPAARVKVVEFIDLECSACRQFHLTNRRVKQKYPNDVAFAFVHYPLPYHRFARPAARAAECAHAMGRFFEMVSVIYQEQDSLGLMSFVEMGRRAGVADPVRFAACTKDTSRLVAVEGGVSAGNRIGISGTPTVVVNGQRFDVPPSDDRMDEIIGDILKAKPRGK